MRGSNIIKKLLLVLSRLYSIAYCIRIRLFKAVCFIKYINEFIFIKFIKSKYLFYFSMKIDINLHYNTNIK